MLYVKIDSQRIELPYPSASSKSGNAGGIAWSYASSSNKVYSTQLIIPHGYFSDGFVRVQFDVYHSLNEDADKVAGIDKVTLEAICSDGRRAQELRGGDRAGTDENGHYYCSAADFPCGEDGKQVNVCHYSSRHGYQTFCVPEADSEVLRFYKNDYCGPCVGFGGTNAE